MLPKDQEKLLNDIHSSVIEYLNDIEIKPNKTEKEIRSKRIKAGILINPILKGKFASK